MTRFPGTQKLGGDPTQHPLDLIDQSVKIRMQGNRLREEERMGKGDPGIRLAPKVQFPG